MPPECDPGHVYHLFPVISDDREALRAHLASSGVETLIHYPFPISRQPALANAILYAATTQEDPGQPMDTDTGTEPGIETETVLAVSSYFGGRIHLFDPETVFRLQHSTRQRRYDIFKQYSARIDLDRSFGKFRLVE